MFYPAWLCKSALVFAHSCSSTPVSTQGWCPSPLRGQAGSAGCGCCASAPCHAQLRAPPRSAASSHAASAAARSPGAGQPGGRGAASGRERDRATAARQTDSVHSTGRAAVLPRRTDGDYQAEETR